MSKTLTNKQRALATMARKQRAFKKLTAAQKRVAIARDVIAQLDLKRFKAEKMTYVWMNRSIPYTAADEQLCDRTAGEKCTVCALGALFIAGVERADKVTVGQVGYGNTPYSFGYLTKFFSEKQLTTVERAFECWRDDPVDPNRSGYDSDSPLAKLNSNDRMRVIMSNIVKNKGRFVAEQLGVSP